MDEGCVFCGIVARKLPVSVVVDTGAVLAFMDIDPVTPGHVLVIPKPHLPDLADVKGQPVGKRARRVLARAAR